MDWIKFVINKPIIALTMPTILGLLQFGAHVVIVLSDGHIDSQELHSLMSTASGLQAVLLAFIMVALKKGNK